MFDTAVGRRVFWNGSDYFHQPVFGAACKPLRKVVRRSDRSDSGWDDYLECGHVVGPVFEVRGSRRCWDCHREWDEFVKDAYALDIAACLNRDLLESDGSFALETAQRFYAFAVETERPWGLRRDRLDLLPVRPGHEMPTLDSLLTELVQSGYWLRVGDLFQLADAEHLMAYWQWFDADQRRRVQVRRISGKQRRRVLARDGGRCTKCGSQTDLQIDHVVPVAAGGSKDDNNLRTLCRMCNSARNVPSAPHATYPGARPANRGGASSRVPSR
jgi:hypothetical protein